MTWLRDLWVWILAFFVPPARPMDTTVLRLRVLLVDLDSNLHMNNARYLSALDAARGHFVVSCRLLRPALLHGWRPLVGSAWVQYRRSLRPFQRYEIHTHIVGWDEKWLYFQHRFMAEGHLAAQALVKVLVKQKGENLDPSELMTALGVEGPSPTLPSGVEAWRHMEGAMRPHHVHPPPP